MNVLVDIRNLTTEQLTRATGGLGENSRFLLTAWQWCSWRKKGEVVCDDRLVIVVPDFLYYARLASTGQAKKIAELPESIAAVAMSCVKCIPTGIRNLKGLARGEFWSGAEALLSFDLGLLGGYKGEIVLHSNLSDFVWVFDKEDFVRRYLELIGKARRTGFACQQIEKAMSACARWQIDSQRFIYPVPFNDNESTAMVDRGKRHSFADCKWTLDLTLWPAELVRGLISTALVEREQEEYLVSYPTAVEILRKM